MASGPRKLALVAHVVSSVGWLGAVTTFLALAITGLSSRDAVWVRAAYLAMEFTAWVVVVPFCIASLVTGFISSVGTGWGLFRHYWVLAKLLMIVPASALLLMHMQPIDQMASVAAQGTLSDAGLDGLRAQLVFEAGAAALVLLVATALSVFKPPGWTRYGWRKQQQERAATQP